MMIWSGHKISQSDTNGVGPRLADARHVAIRSPTKKASLSLVLHVALP